VLTLPPETTRRAPWTDAEIREAVDELTAPSPRRSQR
jgi:hypothetical protein